MTRRAVANGTQSGGPSWPWSIPAFRARLALDAGFSCGRGLAPVHKRGRRRASASRSPIHRYELVVCSGEGAAPKHERRRIGGLRQ
jgi:hypothetical protein